MHERTEPNLNGALTRRGHKSDAGIADTLRPQSDRGKWGNLPINEKLRPVPKVSCWCERRIVQSTWARIKAGEGETCGRFNCHAPTIPTEETTNA